MAFYFDHRSAESGVKNGDGKIEERRGKAESAAVLPDASQLLAVEEDFSIPTAADERDAQRLIFVGGKEAAFRRRQRNGSSTSCFQEIAASHMSNTIPCGCRDKSAMVSSP